MNESFFNEWVMSLTRLSRMNESCRMGRATHPFMNSVMSLMHLSHMNESCLNEWVTSRTLSWVQTCHSFICSIWMSHFSMNESCLNEWVTSQRMSHVSRNASRMSSVTSLTLLRVHQHLFRSPTNSHVPMTWLIREWPTNLHILDQGTWEYQRDSYQWV